MATTDDKLRFGICGLGFMGQTYFGHLSKHVGARVSAVCDRDPARRAGRWGAPVGNIGEGGGQQVEMEGVRSYAEVDELLADDALDVVAITLPTPFHADVTIRALQAGRHVLCEKPMAPTLADCERMIAAAEETGRTLMIAQCIRFWPQYETIKRMADEGRIGAVRFAALRRLASPPTYSAGSWLMDGAQSGGAILDLHLHDVDFARELLGMPATIQACGSRGPSGGIDHVTALYAYPDGRCALLEGGWMFHAPWPFEMAITVHGVTGTFDWSMIRGPDVLWYRGGDEPERITGTDETGWMRELDYFIACVRDGRSVVRCLPSSSRDSIALALLEQQAVERGTSVDVPAGIGGN